MDDETYENTDREIWCEREGDFYADSIHVTKEGGIGINCAGHVFVKPIRAWHSQAKEVEQMREALKVADAALCEARTFIASRADEGWAWLDQSRDAIRAAITSGDRQ